MAKQIVTEYEFRDPPIYNVIKIEIVLIKYILLVVIQIQIKANVYQCCCTFNLVSNYHWHLPKSHLLR